MPNRSFFVRPLLWCFRLWACVLLGLGCGEVDVKFDDCSSCPERCLRDADRQRGQCVACLTDAQCRTDDRPTRICNASHRCVCSTAADCGSGKHCAKSAICVDCLSDAHCTNPRQSVCFENKCFECKPNAQRACSPQGLQVCQRGLQRCRGGIWGTCEGWKPCDSDRCPSGQVKCGGVCVSLTAHGKHCGRCGRACPSGRQCASGACVASCPASTPTSCLGGCVDTQTNSIHCGTCSNACRDDQRCVEGRCQCPSGTLNCDDGGQQRCVDIASNGSHCGACNKACAQGKLCAAGRCVATCPKTTPTVCKGGCIALQTNALHCGKCGVSCRAEQRCVAGSCACVSGAQECAFRDDSPALCIDTRSHRLHCGQCRQQCADGEFCEAGRCVSRCTGSLRLCAGGCVDTQADPAHCGGCQKACGPQQSCRKGVCERRAAWALSGGGKDQDEAQSIAIDAAGNIYVSGYFETEAAFGPLKASANSENKASFVLKLDAKGKVLWFSAAQSSSNNKAVALALGPRGQVYITGYYNDDISFGPHALKNAGRGDLYLARLDAATGDFVWVKGYGSSGEEQGKCLAVGASGDIYLGGSFEKTVTFGKTQLRSEGDEDLFVARLDSAGNFIWAKAAGSRKSDDEALGLALDAIENVYLTGRFADAMQIDKVSLSSRGGDDVFVLKLDKQGALLWAKSAGGSGDDKGHGLAVQSNGDVLVTGFYTSSALFGTLALSAKGGKDVFAFKLNAQGQFLWATSAGGSGDERGSSIAVGKGGDVYVVGSFQKTADFGSTSLTASASHDAFVVRLDPQGKISWARSLQASSTESGQRIALDDTDTPVVTVDFTGAIGFHGSSFTALGVTDISIARLP